MKTYFFITALLLVAIAVKAQTATSPVKEDAGKIAAPDLPRSPQPEPFPTILPKPPEPEGNPVQAKEVVKVETLPKVELPKLKTVENLKLSPAPANADRPKPSTAVLQPVKIEL